MRFELTFSITRCITYTNPTQPFALPTELCENILNIKTRHYISGFEPVRFLDMKFANQSRFLKYLLNVSNYGAAPQI